MSVPASGIACVTLCSGELRNVPFEEPSILDQRAGPPRRCSRAWCEETRESSSTMSLSAVRPIRMTVAPGTPELGGQGIGTIAPSVIRSPAETRVASAIRSPLT